MLTSALIDSREPPDIQSLDLGVPTVVTALDAGDLVATCTDGSTLFVERKTPGDLLGSIADGRLFAQCHAMRELGEFCYLVIVGRMDMVKDNKVRVDGYRITNWNWDSVQGALLTIQELGVGVVYATDYRDAVMRLSKRDRDDVTIHPRRKSEPMTEDAALLASLPDIGAITAQKILGNGPAGWALSWLTNLWDDSLKVPGVGHNQKAQTRRILGLKDRQYLAINLWEDEDGE